MTVTIKNVIGTYLYVMYIYVLYNFLEQYSESIQVHCVNGTLRKKRVGKTTRRPTNVNFRYRLKTKLNMFLKGFGACKSTTSA
uniref:Uncharacterized protein n=1 Tax=Ixodes ricinus TaxID=34613 RepID=V5HBG8_IXORI